MVLPFLLALGPLLASAGGAAAAGAGAAGGALASGAGAAAGALGSAAGAVGSGLASGAGAAGSAISGAAGKLGSMAGKVLPGMGTSEIAEGATQGNMLKDLMNFGKEHPQLTKGVLGSLGGGLSSKFGGEEGYNMYMQQLMAGQGGRASAANTPTAAPWGTIIK
tara:strand:+ start:3549 stop:4040 length:492 start_codon:yes stop_codon:yes gene_type:complete